MYITWDDAVEEGKMLVAGLDASQMRLGEIADRLEPKYGESTLARYAQAIGTNVNTLQNYRSVYRTWHEDSKVKVVPKFSVAKALVKHPDRAKIVENEPEITEREAKEETKKHKEEQAKYEQYSSMAAHKMTKAIVTSLNSFLKSHSPLDEMLDLVAILNALDMEYAEKIIFALGRANERLVEALQRMNIKIETYKNPVGAKEPEEPGEEPTEAAIEEESSSASSGE